VTVAYTSTRLTPVLNCASARAKAGTGLEVLAAEPALHAVMTSGTIRLSRSNTMGRIGLPELLVILAIVIVIFGANRLPDLGRGIGSAIKNFKEGMKDDHQ
jgi:sec-independent protein translocase protein TatA